MKPTILNANFSEFKRSIELQFKRMVEVECIRIESDFFFYSTNQLVDLPKERDSND